MGLLLDGKGFIIRHNAGDDSITIAWNAEEPKSQKIQLDRVPVGYGLRPYFRCPLTGQRCAIIYFHIAFASAEAHGLTRASRHGGRVIRSRAVANKAEARLLGLDGKPPARGAARTAAARKLNETGLKSVSAASEIFEAELVERKRLRRRYRHHGGKGPNSTAAVLKAGAAAHPSLTSQAIVAYLAPRIGEPPADRAERLKDGVGLAPDFPTLDVRALEKVWRLDEDGRWGAALLWAEDRREALTAYLLVSFDVLDGPSMHLEIRSGRKVLNQTIELEPSHPRTPRRWFMRCPVTGDRTELLYFREDRFACAKAQRLVHPSQRAPRPST